MAHFKDRNSQLKKNLQGMPASKENLVAAYKIPNPDTLNNQGHPAYKIEDTLRLVMMLNTLKLEPQYYRSENEQMRELQELIEKVALAEGPYFVCQAIVWSRCLGEGMRSINHLAAALIAPFISGEEYAKRFYSLWNKRDKKGGCIFRPDDMAEIKEVYNAINDPHLSNAMKKGFKEAIEQLDSYSLFKYKKVLRDIANLTHPAARNSKATIVVSEDTTVKIKNEEFTYKEGEKIPAIVAMMLGIEAKADTWEVAQSEAGQEVAKAVKEGKLSEEKAKEVLAQAKSDNWKSLLEDGKLGILACLRNLRNMLEIADPEVINNACALIKDPVKLKQGKIMPYQIDLAYEAIKLNEQTVATRALISAMEEGMEASVDNLKEILVGRNLVVVDRSGSMGGAPIIGDFNKDRQRMIYGYGRRATYTTCSQKAGLIAAMIAKSTNADIIYFGGDASYMNYNPKDSLFTIAKQLEKADQGWTNLSSVFRLISSKGKKYDRIIILSDNAVNHGNVVQEYKNYVRTIGNPYIYTVDLAAYGTAPMAGDHVCTFFGYGYAMFDSIASNEFNPSAHIDKIRQIVI